MDALPTAIADIESRLKVAGVSVSRVCRDAGVDRSAWHKWKFGGAVPRASTWGAIQGVLRPLIGEVADLPQPGVERAA